MQSLHVGYEHRRGPGSVLPMADDFLTSSHWPQLTTLTLKNLLCTQTAGMAAAAMFLSMHANLQVLHLDISVIQGRPRLILPPNSLPHLREIHSSKYMVNTILECHTDKPRPLEVIKGVSLNDESWDDVFFANLKKCGSLIKRVDLAGWSEMEDIRLLADCVPKLTWLNVGQRNKTLTAFGKALVQANVVSPAGMFP
jgi:hypothetical protein